MLRSWRTWKRTVLCRDRIKLFHTENPSHLGVKYVEEKTTEITPIASNPFLLITCPLPSQYSFFVSSE